NRRDELKSYLAEKEIQVGVHYPISLPKLKAYQYTKQANDQMFANASDTSLLSLPIGEHLTSEDTTYVINSIKSFFK
ncbi:MAG: DegT/DnrJ/EryC1/StrS aminotransferase family protein, partial [Bacteroidetes bacterium]|nr:DegT/DnrJ/EryC1/StrS aminotransferase family protein [Bacteroidota bacterium]